MRVQAAVLVSLLFAPALLAQPCVAKLLLVNESTLPGIPVGLTVTVMNADSGVLARADAAQLEERRDSQGEWRAVPFGISERAPLSREDVPSADGARTWSFDPEWMVEAGWFWDWQLNLPGTHDLRVTIVSSKSPRGEVLCTSAPVRMVVEEPRDDDAAVWEFMNSLPREGGWTAQHSATYGIRVVEFIAESAPASRYLLRFAPYAFASPRLYSPKEGDRSRAFQLLDRAIALDPGSSRAQRLRINRALALGDVAVWRASQCDISGAIAVHDQAIADLRFLRAGADSKVAHLIDVAAGQIGSREHMIAMSKSRGDDK